MISEVDENYVPLRNKANDYLIDRKLQKTKSYTGIKGVSEQDAAVQDSQGPIADRTREHLGPTDLGIMHFRKLIMESARALQQGQPPAQLARQDRYAVRSGACVTHKAKDLPAVMIERFGDENGYVGRPRDGGGGVNVAASCPGEAGTHTPGVDCFSNGADARTIDAGVMGSGLRRDDPVAMKSFTTVSCGIRGWQGLLPPDRDRVRSVAGSRR